MTIKQYVVLAVICASLAVLFARIAPDATVAINYLTVISALAVFEAIKKENGK